MKVYSLLFFLLITTICRADIIPTKTNHCVGEVIQVDLTPAQPDSVAVYLKGTFNTYRVDYRIGKAIGDARVTSNLPNWLPSGSYQLYTVPAGGGTDTVWSNSVVHVMNVVLSEVDYSRVVPVVIAGNVIYYKSIEKVGWPVARKNAESMGGVMAAIHDSATNAFLTQYADVDGTWIGASDQKVEKAWRWLDESKFGVTFWAPGEPNNAGNEDYATLRSNGLWNDKFRDVGLSYFMIIDLNFNRTFETVWGGDVKMIPPYIRNATFEWFGPATFFADDSTTELHSYAYRNQGTYFLKITKGGCVSQDLNFKVKVNSEVLDTALYGYAGALNGYDYYLSKYDLFFQQAYDQAVAKGGYLPDIRSQVENDLVSSLQVSGTHVWIGLSDAAHEGRFTYTRDDQAPAYTNWNPGEPNSHLVEEDYVLMWSAGKWNDIFPDYNNRFAIKLPKNISTDSISDFTFCNTSRGFVKFSASGPYSAANEYIVQLSDATGSFTTPIELARGVRKPSDTLGFVIPANVPLGRDYRIRVSSTGPAISGMTSNFKVRISNGEHLLPLIRSLADTLEVDYNPLYTYTWYQNSNIMPGQTTNRVVAPTAATYMVKVEYNGCSSTSSPLFFDPLSTDNSLATSMRIYPNPVRDRLKIDAAEAQAIEVMDLTGRVVLAQPRQLVKEVRLGYLQPGIYYVRLSSQKGAAVYKVVKE